MQLIVFKDYETLSLYAAEEIIRLVKSKPDAVICFASGDTPRLAYKLLVEKSRIENIDFSRVTLVGLDEWVGIPPSNEGSCHYFLKTNLIDQLNFTVSNIHLFDALSEHLQQECDRMDAVIASKNGIDLMLVGLGMNGHIGFNEPGASFNSYSQVIALDNITTAVGQKYFIQATKLQRGISLGLKHLSEAKRVLLLANGNRKAAIIKKVLEEEVNELVPGSIIRLHSNSAVLIDDEAASLLKK